MDIGIKYVLEGARKIKQDIEITTRALVIYHHFMRTVGDVFYDASVVAAAALYLSSRVSEKDIDIDTIVILFYHMVNKTLNDVTPDSMKFKVLRQSFITMTFLIQRMLEFTLNYRIGHEFFAPFLTFLLPRALRLKGFREVMKMTGLGFMSDFYTTKICLNYKPEHIAIASMDAALHIHGFLVDLEVIEPWYEGFCTDLSEDKVKEIKLYILKLYKGEERMRPTSLAPSSQKKQKIAQVSDVQSSERSKSHRLSYDFNGPSCSSAPSYDFNGPSCSSAPSFDFNRPSCSSAPSYDFNGPSCSSAPIAPSFDFNGPSCSSAPSLSSIEITPSPQDRSSSPIEIVPSHTNRSSSPIEIVLSPPGGSVDPLETIYSGESSLSGSSSSESSSDGRSFVYRSSSQLGRKSLALDRPFSHLRSTSTDTPVILVERPSSQLEDISSDEDVVEITRLPISDKTVTRLERTLSSSQLEKALHTQLEKDSSLSETTLSVKPSFPSDKPSFQLKNASLPSETSSQLEKTSASLDKPSSDLLSSKLETGRPSSELEDISSSSTEEGEISD
ncbi:uncharacterized protein TNCV_1859631 [Trichonephila clavipes]|nr:uncharacterized protein TNCV_1859631 [Trichonephila clavipes]